VSFPTPSEDAVFGLVELQRVKPSRKKNAIMFYKHLNPEDIPKTLGVFLDEPEWWKLGEWIYLESPSVVVLLEWKMLGHGNGIAMRVLHPEHGIVFVSLNEGETAFRELKTADLCSEDG